MVAGVCSDQQLSGTCSARKQEENARSTVAVPIGDRHQSYPVQLNQSIKHESEACCYLRNHTSTEAVA